MLYFYDCHTVKYLSVHTYFVGSMYKLIKVKKDVTLGS